MTEDSISRRNALKAIGGTATAMSLAGCTSAIPGVGKSKFQKQLDTVEQAASEYDGNPEKALEDGFVPRGPVSPGLGIRFNHFDRRDSYESVDDIDLSKPTVLTYDSEGNLGAVGFRGRVGALGQSPSLFATENADATEKWSTHDMGTHFMADGNGELTEDLTFEDYTTGEYWSASHPPMDIQPGDTVEVEWGPDKTKEKRVVDHLAPHPNIVTCFVWVGTENPNGIFGGNNPNFAQ